MIRFAPAKINIGLKVLNKRSDSYHNLDSIFYPIPLYDILEFGLSDEFDLVTTGLSVSGNVDDNLIFKAFELMRNYHNIGGLKVHLHKLIPMGAGLGGGSSDAANTLIAINQLYNLHLDDDTLVKYALELGADCPFFIYQKPLRAMETGSRFQDLSLDLSGNYLVLVKLNIHISTAEAYAGVALEGQDANLDMELLNEPDLWKDKYINSFEKHLFQSYPLLANLKDSLYNQGAFFASMSGSGSTIYGLFKDKPDIPEAWEQYFVFISKL